MKKTIVVAFTVLLFIGCSLLGGLEQDIIGTWSDDTDPGFTITFREGGDLVTSESKTGTWKITDKTLVITMDGGGSSALTILLIDAKTMVLSNGLLQFSYTRL